MNISTHDLTNRNVRYFVDKYMENYFTRSLGNNVGRLEESVGACVSEARKNFWDDG